jgi:hypothetical protein
MLKAAQDFEYAGVQIKAGDEVAQGLIEADDLLRYLESGLVVDDAAPKVEPKKVSPTHKAGKDKSK